ncbi:hypothetical protein U1Q18_013801 [Sarracenia purpurea var. burkii]
MEAGSWITGFDEKGMKLRVWAREDLGMGFGQGFDLQRKKKGSGGRRSSVVSEVTGVRESLVGGLRWESEFACESPPHAAAGSDGDGKRYCGRESACESDGSCESDCESCKSPSGMDFGTEKGFFQCNGFRNRELRRITVVPCQRR